MSEKLEVKDAAAKTNEEIVLIDIKPDSLEQEKRKIRERVKKAIKNIETCQHQRTTDGYYTDSLREYINEVHSSYYEFEKHSFESCVRYQRELLEDILMAEDNIIIIFCRLSKEIMQIGYSNLEGKSVEGLFKPLARMLEFLWNISDSLNPEVCKTVLDQTEFISLMVKKLDEMAPNILNQTSNANDITLLECFLGLTHNLGQLEESIKALREVGIVDAFKPYLKSNNESHRQKTLAILADVVNEEESEILKSSENMIQWTITSLKTAINDKMRRNGIGWSVRETVRTIRKVAKDDNNKKKVYTCDAVPILVEVANKPGNTEEQKEAVEALWTLSFDESIQAAIINDPNCKVIETFVKLSKCSDDKDVRKICCEALWTMKNSLKKSLNYKKVGEQFSFNPVTPSASERRDTHIMISYNWDHQSKAKNICSQLRKHGINVWIDIDDMRGSTVQAMAIAVENAYIILMCYSQNYKNSNFCRSEAEYAFQLNKTVIPLKMEDTYKPDGWLGFIIGAKFYYDFSGNYSFEKKMTELINEVQIINKEQNPEPRQLSSVTSVSSEAKAVNVHTMKSSDLEKVKKWSPQDVKKWLDKNLLESCLLGKLGGLEIAFLHVLVNESPDVFYKTIVEELNVKGISTTAKLRFALESFDINT